MTENKAIRGVLWKLHISRAGEPDPSLLIPDAVDAELTRLLDQLQAIADDFVSYLDTVVVPNIDLSPVRVGIIDRVALSGGQNDTNVTDFLLLLGGLVTGGQPVIDQIRTRFDVTAEVMGNWGEVGRWDVPVSVAS